MWPMRLCLSSRALVVLHSCFDHGGRVRPKVNPKLTSLQRERTSPDTTWGESATRLILKHQKLISNLCALLFGYHVFQFVSTFRRSQHFSWLKEGRKTSAVKFVFEFSTDKWLLFFEVRNAGVIVARPRSIHV